MIIKTTEFEIKPAKLKGVIVAIEHFTRAVHVSEPGSRLYVSIQDKKNKNKFIHVMAFENEGAEMKHRAAEYTQEFETVLKKACTKDPIFKEYTYVGGL
jgi:quinol monooxygenase YgiN